MTDTPSKERIEEIRQGIDQWLGIGSGVQTLPVATQIDWLTELLAYIDRVEAKLTMIHDTAKGAGLLTSVQLLVDHEGRAHELCYQLEKLGMERKIAKEGP